MARRTARRSHTIRPAASRPADPGCPCGLPAAYDDCCGRLHRGEAAAATAEQLMRSRFAAFARRDEAYLLRSWHRDTRPASVSFDPGTRWERLEILATKDGSAFHTEGTVEFRAHFTDAGHAGALHETSRFTRQDGAWVYVDGVIDA